MATVNPFDILGDDDNDDPSQLIAVQQQKIAAKKPAPAATAAAKLPSKPAPPAQAVRDARGSSTLVRGTGIGGGRGGPGRGRGRGGPFQNREYGNGNVNGFSGTYGGTGGGGEDGDTERPPERERGSYGGPRQPYRGGHRGGYRNGEGGEDSERPPRRMFERRSGTGRGTELKREGSGRGNWGSLNDDVPAQETEETAIVEDKTLAVEKQPAVENVMGSEEDKESKEGVANKNEEKEEEDKEMTLEEYEKIREEKRKALLALKAEERKVEFDKEFESMQQLSLKKGDDEVFIKLGSEKDSKRKDADERVKKSVSINEFLKPAEGEYHSPRGRGGGRGRGRGRGDRAPTRGAFGVINDDVSTGMAAPSIDDHGHFPTLVGSQ